MSALTVGAVAVKLPANGYKLRHAWVGESALMVGYDPRWLTFDLVKRLVCDQYGADTTIIQGVPA